MPKWKKHICKQGGTERWEVARGISRALRPTPFGPMADSDHEAPYFRGFRRLATRVSPIRQRIVLTLIMSIHGGWTAAGRAAPFLAAPDLVADAFFATAIAIDVEQVKVCSGDYLGEVPMDGRSGQRG